MKKKSFRKILSALCAMTTMTICFSKVQAAPLENTNSIDQSKSYIIYSGDTNKTLYDDGGNNEGWLRQGKFLDFDKNFKWKLEKNGNNFYLKNEGTTWYVNKTAKTSQDKSYVVSDKTNTANNRDTYSFEKVDGGYKLKSVSNGKYIKYGQDRDYITFANNASDASVWKIEEAPTVDSSKNYIIYSTNTNNTIFDDGGNTDGWVRKGTYAKFQKKFTWSFEEGNTGLYIKNLLTKSYLKETHGTVTGRNINYALTEKTNGVAKGEYTFERIFNTGGSYKIKCNNTG
ncbi:MAG: RICIN domain-containing protein, partial [Clostridium sp.]